MSWRLKQMKTGPRDDIHDAKSSDTKRSPISDAFKRRIPGFFFHYKLLLWKTAILRIRKPWVIIAELVLPIIVIIAIVGLRAAEMPSANPSCHVVSQPLPSMGFINYMRGVFCNFNYSCSPHDVDDQSQSNVVPTWITLLGNYSPIILQEVPLLLRTLAESEYDDRFSLDQLMCHDSFRNIANKFLSPSSFALACCLPTFTEHLILEKVIHFVEGMLPKKDNFFSLDSMNLNFTNIEDQIINGSIILCGDQIGSNSFLNFIKAAKEALGDNVVKNTFIKSQATSRTTGCSLLNAIFDYRTLQPWTRRLRTALQGEVFYYPVNKMTDEVMKKANTTAVMLEKLKGISKYWTTSMNTLLPEIVINSTVFKALRAFSKLCSINPSIDSERRDQCLRLDAFLQPTSTTNYTHWTELLPAITGLSNAADDILTNCVVYDRFHGFSNYTKMLEQLEKAIEFNKTAMGIEFNESNTFLSMQFRLKPDIVDSTSNFKVVDKNWTPAPRHDTRDSMKYFTSGFIDLQDQVERAYIALVTKTLPPADPYLDDFLPTEMQFFPAPCYQTDKLLRLFAPNMPLIIVVIWLCNYVISVRGVVYEKEIRLKEYTKVMGMGNAVHWLNWFTVGFIMMSVSSIIVTVLLKYGQILPRIDGFLLFCCFICYILSILPQAFMVSVFFTNANFGAAFSGIFYFIMYAPYNLILIYDLDFAPLIILTFSPQCLIAMTFSRLMTMETQGVGGQWHSLWTNDISNDSISLGLCLVMFIIDAVLAWILVWYLENVVPNKYGLVRKWYFFLTQSYWKEVFYGRLNIARSIDQNEAITTDIDATFHEPAWDGLNVGVSVRGLTKCFGRKKVVAINNMWIDFYENQITSFLGHNGAGKTTIISILTGTFAPSSGTAYVYGQDINYEMPEIRQHLGLCPQHNILFDSLSVAEHIQFYGYLKGLSKTEVNEEVEKFLFDLELENKANELSKNLSGGQKRRLSLAAAFVGGSKMVFLDEPTSGIDPSSRRAIWNLIFRFKESRTIILTTHHMDEADVLGDRIAILSQGRVKASGSSLFLKSKFAKHYYLSMEKADGVTSDAHMTSKLTNLISTQLEGSKLAASTPTGWVHTLPAEKAFEENGFVKFFAYLEERKNELSKKFGVTRIGLTDTSLEEIFILLSDDPSKIRTENPITQKKKAFIRRLFRRHTREQTRLSQSSSSAFSSTCSTDAEEDSDFEMSSKHETTDVEPEDISVKRNTGCRLYLQQCHAFLTKRKQCIRRKKCGWMLEVIIPAIVVVIVMVIVTNYAISANYSSMPLHPWLMSIRKNVPHLYTFFSNTPTNNSKISATLELYSQAIASANGWSGTRCLPHSTYQLVPNEYAYCNTKDYTVPNPLPSLTPEGLLRVDASEQVNCSCDNGLFDCPSDATVTPPSHLLPTTDFLLNLTYYNVSNYLLKSRNEAILKRYGGLTVMVTRNGNAVVLAKSLLSNQTLVKEFLNLVFNISAATSMGLDLADFIQNGLPPTQYSRVWYDNKGYASSVAYLNVLHNLQLRMLLTKENIVLDPENHGIATANYPLPSLSVEEDRGFVISLILELVKAISVVFTLTFVSASFSTFVIRERHCGSMAMQLLAGQNRFVYWVMSYLWDFCNIIIPTILVLVIFAIFNEQAYIRNDHIGGLISLMLASGLAIIPMTYCISFAFRLPSVAFISLIAINIIITLITSIVTFMLELMSYNNPPLELVVRILEKAFLIFPQFAFIRGFYELSKRHTVSHYGMDEFIGTYELFDWDVLAVKLVALLIEAVVFFAIVLLISYTSGIGTCKKCTRRSWRKMVAATIDTFDNDFEPGISKDVLEEIQRVKNDPMNAMQDVVRAFNLTKFYSNKKTPAVANLTFGVRPGECFGLLGVNGAGKTTTFGMLTTTIHPTSGTIHINDYAITENKRLKAHNLIGYCPQSDALLPHLTGFETIQLFARIHGYPENVISGLADRLIDRLSLRPFADQPVNTYSGGNLRKLSTAVATVGHPQVLLLDEPTSGMDPGAKRCLWEVIKSLQQEGCSVVLTSHSMEECEALCNRLAIMMDGQFQCFGTVAHLKQRFGEGYILEVDLNLDELGHEVLFPPSAGILLTDAVGKKCNFEARGEVKLSQIFRLLVDLRSAGKITTFAVRQVSLDSVFVNFVRSYKKEIGDWDSDDEDSKKAEYESS